MGFFKNYLRYRYRAPLALLLCALVFSLSFYLFRIPVKAVLYPAALCLLLLLVFGVLDYHRVMKTHKELERIKKLRPELIENLPDSLCLVCDDYRELVGLLCREREENLLRYDKAYRDMVDYYTVWAHQIKIPIASMRLRLQSMDSDRSRQLLSDLGRVERYSDMVMTFLRLDSDSSDYVFREIPLDPVIRSAVKKFAGDFIVKKLSLRYEPVNKTVLTDEKWLSFVLEQLISNAIKYTNSGGITVYLDGERLCIRDTGIGISPDELPRIFERGYTGSIGRSEKAASGIGLYLCKRICENLGHGLSVRSVLGEGSEFSIDLSHAELELE